MEGGGLHVFTTPHPCAEECRSCWEPVGCTHPTIAGFTPLYRCWKNLQKRATLRHVSRGAVAFRGREEPFANLGSTRRSELPVGFSGVGLHRGAGRTGRATVRQRFC